MIALLAHLSQDVIRQYVAINRIAFLLVRSFLAVEDLLIRYAHSGHNPINNGNTRWLKRTCGDWTRQPPPLIGAPVHSLKEATRREPRCSQSHHKRRREVALYFFPFWKFIRSEALPISQMRAQGQINIPHCAQTVWRVNKLWCAHRQTLTFYGREHQGKEKSMGDRESGRTFCLKEG